MTYIPQYILVDGAMKLNPEWLRSGQAEHDAHLKEQEQAELEELRKAQGEHDDFLQKKTTEELTGDKDEEEGVGSAKIARAVAKAVGDIPTQTTGEAAGKGFQCFSHGRHSNKDSFV